MKQCFVNKKGQCRGANPPPVPVSKQKGRLQLRSVVTLPNDFPTGSLGKAKRMCKRPKFIAHYSNGRIISTTVAALSTTAEIFYHFYVVLGQNHRAKYTFFVAPFALKTPVSMRVPRHLWQNICYTYIYVKQTCDRYRPLTTASDHYRARLLRFYYGKQ